MRAAELYKEKHAGAADITEEIIRQDDPSPIGMLNHAYVTLNSRGGETKLAEKT